MRAPLQSKGKASSSAPPSFTPVPSRLLQRKCACCGTLGPTGECDSCRKKKLQRRSENLDLLSISHPPSSVSEVPPIVPDVSRCSSLPVDDFMRSPFASHFGHDFNRLLIHTDLSASESAEAMAHPYTPDRHILFGTSYHPETTAGGGLLADELPLTQQTSVPTLGRMTRYSNLQRMKSEVKMLRNKRYTCPPVPASLANIHSLGGADALGYTKLESTDLLCAPEFKIDAGGDTGTMSSLPIRFAAISKFAKPEKETPTSDKVSLPSCKGDIPVFQTITPAISDLLKIGEQEHCSDLNRAFELTLKPCATTLAKYVGHKFPGKDEDECFASLVDQGGFDPLDCTQEFIDLAKKTDERDVKEWHSLDETLISADCKKVVVGVGKSATTKIGSIASSKLIPASTKCPHVVAPVGGPKKKTHSPGKK
jgi:hypothetical protein